MKLTGTLAEFIVSTPAERIGLDARLQARRAMLDTVGVMLAGSTEECSRIAAQFVRDQAGAGDAVVVGQRLRAPASEAALVNGTSAHALDFDDVNMSMRGHPSVPLVPAVLALGEKLGATGREVVDAFVVGFEVECKIGRLIGAPHYALGWHPTSTFGTLGSAAACARLLRLDAEGTQSALGIAASLASGARKNFGSMTKPLHAGWAARNGVVAASLAQAGFTADAEALEGEAGYLCAASGGAEFDPSPIERLGEPWEVVSPGIGVKLYPCCYFTHLAVDSALDVGQAIANDVETVDAVHVSVSPGTMMVLRKTLPATGLEGKFSMEYCVATALLDGAVTLESFSDEAVARTAIQDLLAKVAVTEDGPPANAPIGGRAEVTIVLRDGSSRSAHADVPRGDPKNPLSWDQIAAKFRDCARSVLDSGRTEETIDLTGHLDELPSIRDLTKTLEGGD